MSTQELNSHRKSLCRISVAFLSITLLATALAAQVQEEFFLAESGIIGDSNSTIFRVALDAATVPPRALLTRLEDIDFEQVDAIACTPGGGTCYLFDKYVDPSLLGGGRVGVYDVVSDGFSVIGEARDNGVLVQGIVLAAFSPDGILIVGSESTDQLYEASTSDGSLTLIGRVRESNTLGFLDLQGADLVFSAPNSASPEAFLWTNAGANGAPSGLYSFSLPANFPGTIEAEFLETTKPIGFTGLALRENGFGNLLLSSRADDAIEDLLSIGPAPTSELFFFFEDPFFHDHVFGDLSNGYVLGPPVCRSPGFWSTHGGHPNRRGRGNNLTEAAIISAGGSVNVCGQEIDTSLPIGDLSSALEGLCVRVQGVRQRRLYRQLVAARLNCALSGAENCSTLVPTYAACDSLCEVGSNPDITTRTCMRTLNCFNNGGIWDDNTRQCVFEDGNCHERSFCDSPDPELCFDPLGPATSSKQCKRARRNDCTIDSCP